MLSCSSGVRLFTYLRALKANSWTFYQRSEINGGQAIRWSTNSDGFRGKELLSDPAVRIMVYGDSNIQARFSDLQNTYSYRLQEYLSNITGQNIEVINAGTIGFGPDQSMVRFSMEVKKYKPDLVNFHIYAENDFGDLLRNNLFSINAQTNTIEPNYTTVYQNSNNWSIEKLKESITSLLVARAASKLWKMIESSMGIDTSKESEPKAQLTMTEQFEIILSASERDYNSYKEGNRVSGDHYDVDIALFPDKESSETKRILMEHVLENARMLADSESIEFLVTIQPSSRDMTTNLDLNHKKFSQYPEYKRENLTSAVEKLCLENNINTLNLFDLFMENEPERLFFKGRNDHWNDAGQDLAARETAQHIYNKFLSDNNTPPENLHTRGNDAFR